MKEVSFRIDRANGIDHAFQEADEKQTLPYLGTVEMVTHVLSVMRQVRQWAEYTEVFEFLERTRLPPRYYLSRYSLTLWFDLPVKQYTEFLLRFSEYMDDV